MGWASQLNVHTAVFAIFWQWTILLLMANVVSIWWYVQSWCLLTSGICNPNFFLTTKNILVSHLKQNCFSCIAICQSKILLRLKLFRFFSSSNYWFQYYLQMCRARRIWKATREVAKWNDIGSAKVLEIWRKRLGMSSTTHAVLEQIRVCAKISIDCMDLNPAKRPDIYTANNWDVWCRRM